MHPIYTVEKIREIEQAAIQSGVTGKQMMKRAGEASFMWMDELWPDAETVLVVCGTGNNGGDGYILAHNAFEKDHAVSIRHVGELAKLKGEALDAYQQCKDAGIEIQPFDVEEEIEADVIVDAILGIGLEGSPRDDVLEVIEAINDMESPVLSLDIPSGLNVNEGVVLDDAVVADNTVTFIGLKAGLLTGDGPAYCGDLCCHDLDLSETLYDKVEPFAFSMELDDFEGILGLRANNSHKGDYGHVLVIGGAPGMSGAPKLAALGSLRTGAGLVSVATHLDHAAILNGSRPEIMSHGVNDENKLKALCEKATVLAVGPGFGVSDWSEKLFQAAAQNELPMVIDADGLALLKKHSVQSHLLILTPHPGEAANLLDITADEVQSNRFKAAKEIAEKYNAMVVLKGSGTVIASPQGELIICDVGNPGMASGGMGDLLTGIIAGLLAQGVDIDVAAAMGACLHGAAGDAVSEKGERGMLATDLLPVVRELVNSV